MVALPYVTPEGGRSRGVTRAGPPQAIVGTLCAVVLAAGLVHRGDVPLWRVGAVFASNAVVSLITGYRYHRRAGGFTGDFLGATEQLCELAGLSAMVWVA
jgi:cobalamin synthase